MKKPWGRGAVLRDAYAVQLAVQRFNAGSGLYPVLSISVAGSNYIVQEVAVPKDLVDFLSDDGAYATNYRQINWAAQVPVRRSNGEVVSLSFIPPYVLKREKEERRGTDFEREGGMRE